MRSQERRLDLVNALVRVYVDEVSIAYLMPEYARRTLRHANSSACARTATKR